jgi:hypothetical protein
MTLTKQSVQKLSTKDDVVRRLRSAKKFNRALMVEAAAWVESICDDDND